MIVSCTEKTGSTNQTKCTKNWWIFTPLNSKLGDTIHIALGCQVVNDRLLYRKKPVLQTKPKVQKIWRIFTPPKSAWADTIS
jgi:hypothetical protein